MKILAIVIVGFLAASAEAQAAASVVVPSRGWEFARWGMSPEQLRAASRGAVLADNPGSDQMGREYSMTKFKFKAVFDYVSPSDDPGNTDPKTLKLDAVLLNLNLKSGTCIELTTYLKTIYGKPDQKFVSGPAGLLWHEKELGDDIEYFAWNEHKGCTVMYMPLGAKN